MSKKSEQKKLKTPDVIEVKGTELLEKVVSNKNLIVGVLGGLFIAVSGYQGFSYYKKSQAAQQIVALSEIDQSFQQELKVVTDKKEENKKEIEDLRLAIQKDKSLKSKNEKLISDLEKKSEKLKVDHSKSKVEYKKFYEANSTSNSGKVAGLRYAAMVIESDKDYKTAKEIAKKIFDNSLSDSLIFMQSGLMLVSIAENESTYDEAISVLDQMMKFSPKGLQSKLLYRKAEVAILKKDITLAGSTIDKLEKDYSSSQEATEVTSLKALL